MERIVPGESIPENMFETLDAKAWPVSEFNIPRNSPNFYLLVIYRGVQCSYCKNQLVELNEKIPSLNNRNIDVIAVSTDTEKRARQAKNDWDLSLLRLGFNLSIDAARKMGLYVSSAKRETEMPYFFEPGLFLIDVDQKLFAGWIATYPLARPNLDEIINSIDLILEKNLPIRGTA